MRDPKKRTICGVGYLDDYKTRSSDRPYYILWVSMLRRCYDPKNKDFARYGGRGVTVCERWHSLKLFQSDVIQLPGHSNWKAGEGYHFDKDLKVPGNKTYGPNVCQFVPAKANLHAARVTPISIDGVCFRSVQEATEALGAGRGTIQQWLSKKRSPGKTVASLLPWHPYLAQKG